MSGKSSAVEIGFNVISPSGKSLADPKKELKELRGKNWEEVLL